MFREIKEREIAFTLDAKVLAMLKPITDSDRYESAKRTDKRRMRMTLAGKVLEKLSFHQQNFFSLIEWVNASRIRIDLTTTRQSVLA